MQIQCPHCGASLRIDVEHDVRADGGVEPPVPDGLRGGPRSCHDCGRWFGVYVY